MLITISIVSHGHGHLIRQLISDLNEYNGFHSLNIVVTLNTLEEDILLLAELEHISKWPLNVITNHHSKGFAENHNHALRMAKPGIWCVVNPDVRMDARNLDKLVTALLLPNVGIAFPSQRDTDGRALEHARHLVTPWSLLKRYIVRAPERPSYPDWVSGCFLAFRHDVFETLKGFDEKYFLYCEDVDICLRVQLAGYKLVDAGFDIVHDTRRQTLKSGKHFAWHLASLFRLWRSDTYWKYLNQNRRSKPER